MNTKELPELLLVEDNRDDEIMSLRAISHSGVPCRVTVRRDGIEALEYLQEPGRSVPALIVLNNAVPKPKGANILAELKSDTRTRLIPVVILSDSRRAIDQMESYWRGANSFLIKPIDHNEYTNLLCAVTRYWLTVNITSHH